MSLTLWDSILLVTSTGNELLSHTNDITRSLLGGEISKECPQLVAKLKWKSAHILVKIWS